MGSRSIPSPAWASQFIDQSCLHTVRPTSLSVGRASLQRSEVEKWFGILSDLYRSPNYDPSLIFNMDETMVHEIPQTQRVRLIARSEHAQAALVARELYRHHTLIGAVSPEGGWIGPLALSSRKTIDEREAKLVSRWGCRGEGRRTVGKPSRHSVTGLKEPSSQRATISVVRHQGVHCSYSTATPPDERRRPFSCSRWRESIPLFSRPMHPMCCSPWTIGCFCPSMMLYAARRESPGGRIGF